MAKKTTKKSTRGGAREGAGKKLLYGEPLIPSFTCRVNDEQGKAIGAWCRAKKLAPATLVREVGLLRAGAASLGLGIAKAKGAADKAVTLDGAACFPIKCTAGQAKAIRDYCAKKKVAPGSWLREAALEYIGQAKLGIRGQVAALDRAL